MTRDGRRAHIRAQTEREAAIAAYAALDRSLPLYLRIAHWVRCALLEHIAGACMADESGHTWLVQGLRQAKRRVGVDAGTAAMSAQSPAANLLALVLADVDPAGSNPGGDEAQAGSTVAACPTAAATPSRGGGKHTHIAGERLCHCDAPRMTQHNPHMTGESSNKARRASTRRSRGHRSGARGRKRAGRGEMAMDDDEQWLELPEGGPWHANALRRTADSGEVVACGN